MKKIVLPFLYVKIFLLGIFTNRFYWRVKFPTGGSSPMGSYNDIQTLLDKTGGKAYIDYPFIIKYRKYLDFRRSATTVKQLLK